MCGKPCPQYQSDLEEINVTHQCTAIKGYQNQCNDHTRSSKVLTEVRNVQQGSSLSYGIVLPAKKSYSIIEMPHIWWKPT